MEMISKYNEDIYEAYEELEIMSKDKNARAIYEARQKEIRDILTRENEAKAEGKAEAELSIAQKLREQGLSDDLIKLTTGIDLSQLK